jgi:hypothetical protein
VCYGPPAADGGGRAQLQGQRRQGRSWELLTGCWRVWQLVQARMQWVGVVGLTQH